MFANDPIAELARRLAAGALLALALAASAGPARAQAPTRTDSAAVLLDAAARLDAEGREDAADALYDLILRRYGDTPSATRVRALARGQAAAAASRGARTELTVWGTTYGLWTGVAVPAALGADGAGAYGLGLLLGGPAGFLASRAYAHARPLTVGDARAVTLGGTWGTWQGFGWSAVADWGEGTTFSDCVPGPEPCIDTSSSEDPVRARFASALVGGLVGIGVGAWIADRAEVEPGTATMVNFGALWATGYGLGAGAIAGLEDDALLATTLLAGDAGLIATALAAPAWDVSRPRARLINIAGVAGVLGGVGLDLLIQPDDEKVGYAIPMATGAVGLTIGVLTTRGMDRRGAGDSSGTGSSGQGPSRTGAGETGAAVRGAGGRSAGGGALVRRSAEGWKVGAPVLGLARSRAPGRPDRPALRLTLLRAALP